MGKRKAANVRTSPISETKSTHELRQLTENEASTAYRVAKRAKKLYGPMHLSDAWRRWRHNHTLPGFVADLRKLINDPELNEPSLVSGHLARFIELTLVRFERLVELGLFDSALPRLTALPILYSPRAGKGASEWQKAKNIYKQKKVGTLALLEYRGRDPQTARNPVWGELAEIAARVVHLAALEHPIEVSRKDHAVAFRDFENKYPGAKKSVRFTLYLLNDKSVLIWPKWFDLCDGLSERISNDFDNYKRAAKAVLDEFFADPRNIFANDVLKKLLESPSGYSRAEAVKQAIKIVLACMDRL